LLAVSITGPRDEYAIDQTEIRRIVKPLEQAQRIETIHGIREYVEICIRPSPKPNRIALHVAARRRVVVAVVVAEETGLAIVILARESEVEL